MRKRMIYGTLLLATIAAGLASRQLNAGVYALDKSLGDALYATAVYLALRVLWPHASPWRAGAAALAICLAVEAFKFTGLPAQWRGSALSRVLLGTTPSWHNALCYLLGAGLVAAGEMLLPARRRR